ncbi:MAG: CinA family protein [Nitrospirae bacterium]|nr:CinA family protein [Nitrospirota bacterium]
MGPGISDAIRSVHGLFKERGLTLSAAESCTGGLISHYVTALPGASVFFTAGVVAYSEKIKTTLLGVSPEVIRNSGIVSAETAVEMAEKVRSLAKTDYSVSTTGNLGPDVLEGKEKGLVYIAVSKDGKTVSREIRLKGSREENKAEAALEALRLLLEVAERG